MIALNYIVRQMPQSPLQWFALGCCTVVAYVLYCGMCRVIYDMCSWAMGKLDPNFDPKAGL